MTLIIPELVLLSLQHRPATYSTKPSWKSTLFDYLSLFPVPSPPHSSHSKHIILDQQSWCAFPSPFSVAPKNDNHPLTTQTSIGTGYDLSNSVFSPDGRNFQVSPRPSYACVFRPASLLVFWM